jgi:hypothetical protein
MTLVRVQDTKAAVRTLRYSARHTQARTLVSDYYQGSYTCLSWMNSSDLHLVSSTSIPVGFSIIVLHHLLRPPPRPAQPKSSPPLPNDTPLVVLSESHPLVRLGLDDKFDANVKIKIYFDIDINHLASLHFFLPDLGTFNILSSHPVVLTPYPPPFRPARGLILTRLPDVEQTLERYAGHNTARGLGHVRSEDGRTNERQEELSGQEPACVERRHFQRHLRAWRS